MNPRIATDYAETGRWLRNFVTAHARREDARLVAMVEMGAAREGRAYGLRLALAGRVEPAVGEPSLELGYAEVVEGRTRFAWCEATGRRVRDQARRCLERPG